MSKLKKITLYSILALITVGLGYLYVWEKPKLEKLVENYVESLSKDKSIPFQIEIGKTNFSIIPLQVELFKTKLIPKKKLSSTIDPLTIDEIALRPSLIDLLIGKFWLSLLQIKGSDVKVHIPKSKNKDNSKTKVPTINFDKILSRIPLSELDIKNIRLSLNYQDEYFLQTENLYLKGYNEKSSFILTLKDPNLGIKTKSDSEHFNFLTELQVMVTKNSLSLSKLKFIKDSSYFLASGNLIFKGTPDKIQEMQIKTRLNVDFEKLKTWSNQLYKNSYFDILKGQLKTDIQITQKEPNRFPTLEIESNLNNFQVEDVILGDVNSKAIVHNKNSITIPLIETTLVGNNKVDIKNIKINIEDETNFTADIKLHNAELHSFLKESTIADIPVWMKVNGEVSCKGHYKKQLKVNCPGSISVNDVVIKNKSRTKKIVAAKKVNISGDMIITEKEISYIADGQIKSSKVHSEGTIDFDKGFNINYSSDLLDFEDVGLISDLSFKGTAKGKGSTEGNSDTAIFNIDIAAENFEFEEYFFGQLRSDLHYKVGILSFQKLEGNLESTRFNGYLNVDLIQDNINGDLQLPFFRMNDIQQAILKKVNLENRFTGSGSGRIRIDSPFETDQMNFFLDARLFKGTAFGEDYNEAKIQANAVDGIIIIKDAKLQREKSIFNLKGTLDTKFNSKLKYQVTNGFLQLSSLLKQFELPIAGEFNANGTITGPLTAPTLKAKANIENLFFNKTKYGPSIFTYDNSNKQTNLQFNIKDKLELLVLFPENNTQEVFIDLNSNELDLAPFIGYSVSKEATRNYEILITGEASGKLRTNDYWNSEFSSTIQKIELDYKSNKVVTKIPTNIELKNNKLFFNELSLVGNKQYIKINQPYSHKYNTKFIINSRVNIAFFKLLAPFIEKIDGFSQLRLEVSLKKDDLLVIGNSLISESFIKLPGFPHPFENLTADVLFNQNKVSINSISADLAGGSVLGNGEVVFKGGKDYDLIINTSMEDVNIKFPEGFDTRGRGSVSLSGSGLPFMISGQYNVTEGLIDYNFDSKGSSTNSDMLEELLKKEVSTPLMINLDIKTENSVEVKNSLVEGYIHGDIKIFDKITSPRIKGEAHFETNSISTSVVKFNETEFDIASSSFLFEGQTPINPKLSLRSKTRLKGYDIDLFLQGRASKPILTLTSQPPLPKTQIISMLALGQAPDQFENASNATTQNSSGFEIGTSLLDKNPLGKELKERLDVDVQFSSSFDDQNNAAVPKVTIRKKVSKNLQISVSQTTGSVSQSEGRVSYDLSNGLSTIFKVTNFAEDNDGTSGTNSNTNQQNNPFGIDLEYKLEFD